MSFRLRSPWWVATIGSRAHLQRLRQRLVGRVRDVDDHAEPVHLADDGPAVFGEAVPAGRRAAGVGVLVAPVVRGELHDPEPQPVERPQHVEVAVEIEAALEIEHRGHLPGPVDPLDVGGIARELDDLAVLLELIERHVHQAERLLRLVPCGVVLLRHEQRHEEGVDAPFLHARQVHLPVGQAVPDVPAQVQLAVDHVDVPVEDEGVLVLPAGLLRHPRRLLRLRGHQQDEWNGHGDELGSHRCVSCARFFSRPPRTAKRMRYSAPMHARRDMHSTHAPAVVDDPHTPGLVRTLGLWDVTAITAGTILARPSSSRQRLYHARSPHPALALLLWVVGRADRHRRHADLR